MDSVEDGLALADRLVEFLKSKIRDTHHRPEWTERNFDVLREFSDSLGIGAECYPSAKNIAPEQKARQFLWDFIAYKPQKGILLAVESEHMNDKHSILEDFEKLLYVRSPVKLMMCRVHDPANAERQAIQIKDWAQDFMEQTCTWYSPGEVFILYCVYWSGEDRDNRDFAFRLRIAGEFDYCSITSEKFEAI